jgi:hypothetical protein
MRHCKSTSLIFSFLLVAGVAFAHHSGVMFDRGKEVTLKGTVQEFVFANPHVSIRISVVDSNGTATDWSFEEASTQALVRSGGESQLSK